jgi:SAM-dependent MidA family methyltransferase
VSASGSEDPRLVISKYASYFAHMGEVYIYHDLYGFILKMSPDILEFFLKFESPVDPAEPCTEFSDAFGEQPPEAFVGIFIEFCCLVPPNQDADQTIWGAVPVKSKWNVYKRHDDGTMTVYAGWGSRAVQKHALSIEEVAIWDMFDSETKLDTLREVHDEVLVASLVKRLAHHRIQAIKLSKVRLSFFEGRQNAKPAYLTSTMPYRSYDPDTDPTPKPFTDLFSPEAYYEREVVDAESQFDHQETTLSHLLRENHDALEGKRYGDALVDGLRTRGLLSEGKVTILEIGGGLGYVAQAICETLQSLGKEVDYQILELCPALATAQRERTEGLPVTIHEGNALEIDWPAHDYDFILANEMIGDLPAQELTQEMVGWHEGVIDEEKLEANMPQLGVAGELIKKYTLKIADCPETFYLNVGAFQLLERVADHLAPEGFAVLTEFGEINRYPILSTHLDHPELSIHFGQMAHVAKSLGLEVDVAYVMDVIGLNTDFKALSTTRSYFKCLSALMADHDIALQKIGYTEEMLNTLTAGKLALEQVGELYFERLEERFMGLVPYDFKALIVGKKTVGTRSPSSLLR